jgi:uncharacterized protein
MKFLTFVDLHEDKKAFNDVLERSKKDDIEFVVCAGDLTEFGRNLRYFLKRLNNLNKKVYIIHGNHETDEMLNECLADYPNCINFNHKAIRLGKYLMLGYGEGGFAQQDAQFRKIARDWYSKYNGEKIILVTHGPPFGSKVDLLEMGHVGNKDFRKFAERIKVKLLICGHLHDTAGVIEEVNGVKIINPGWEGMIIEMN